ncbi:MAG: glycoside hydrolase domain-containing protein [Terracoccus sp.]
MNRRSRTPRPLRHAATATLLGALVVTGSPTQATAATAAAGAASSTTPAGTLASASAAVPGAAQAPARAATKTVTYRGVSVSVPATWPVVDLDADPTRCVRLDEPVVYVGTAGAQQDCPAHLVGRAETVWLHRSTGSTRAATSAPSTVGSLTARSQRNRTSATKQAWFTGPDVTVDATWSSDEPLVDAVLASATPTAGPVAPAPAPSSSTPQTPQTSAPAAPASPSVPAPTPAPTDAPRATTSAASRALTRTVPQAAGVSQTSVFTGMGFDACAAPSTAAMKAWYSASPYRALGVYIGGSMRACGDGNLSSAWVSSVTASGWGLMPIYVGPQAPCVDQKNLATIDPARAAAQGTANATDAVSRAQAFGLGASTPIYYDMESYNSSVAGCTRTVLTFLSAWTTQLHKLGYRSAVYGGPASLMVDLSNAMGTSGYVAPDDVWFAHWNGLQTLSDSAAFPAFKDSYWADGQRAHQYANLTQTWGGFRINIDANWVGSHVAGRAVTVDYGPNVFGPGGTSFVFTGSMSAWYPNPTSGLRGRAHATYANGATESHGATWSPQLPAGVYDVSAYVPETRATAVVPYTVTDADGTTVTQVNQASVSGYTSLGRRTVRSGQPITVHVADNGPSSGTAQVGVDAMRFQLVAIAPSAPTAVTSVPGDKRATVRWTAAAGNGAAVTGYTVRAYPGGATVSVVGSATSATVAGLTNGTAYTFTVTATSSAGTGPGSAASVAVTPELHGHLVPVSPTRLVDTRHGTATNAVRTALAPGASLTLRVAGLTGSPVPAGASSAALNLTVTTPQYAGFLTVDAVAGTGSSTTNFVTGQTVANMVLTRLTSSGRTTVTNHSGGTVHLVIDVEGYIASSGPIRQWSPVAPTRVLDTRYGTPTNSVRTAMRPGAALTIRVAGASGSPVPAGSSAVALNLTAVSPTRRGFLTVDAVPGGTSTANFAAGTVVANLTIARLSSTGTTTIVNHSGGTVHVVVDVEGYLAATGSTNQWVSTTPVRVLDTRHGTTPNPVRTAVGPGDSLVVRVAGAAGSPVPAGAAVAIVNVTVTSPQGAGFLTVDSAPGGTSTANFRRGQTVANLVFTRLSSGGTTTLVNHSGGTVHVILDAQGYLH